MNQFEDIEKLWKINPEPVLPSANDIILKSEAEKKKLKSCFNKQVFYLFLSVVSLILVLVTVKFNMLSSLVGIGLMFAAIMGFIILRLKQNSMLNSINFNNYPDLLIEQFQRFYRLQKWVNSSGTLVYVIILNLGFGFYFYETLVLAAFTPETKIIFIILYIVWMLVATLVIGRISNKKEQKKTTVILDNLRKLKESLENQA